MASVDQLLREFRKTLLAIDRADAQRILQAHRQHVKALAPVLRELLAALRQAGQIDDALKWMRETDSVYRLLALAESGSAEFARYAAERIEARRLELVELSRLHDERLTYAAIVGNESVVPATRNAIRAAFTAIPVQATESIVGALQPGSPVRAIFDRMGVEASRRIGETLVDGITRGQGAAQIGRRLRADLDHDASRALTIARTETHRAYRTSSLDRYRSNPRVYAGWRWHANLDSATCPVCVSQHGSVHDLDEDFGSHPNCRCRPVPIPNALTEILGDDSEEARRLEARLEAAQPDPDSGAKWFARQSEDVQRGILGPLKHDAFKTGDITLADVVIDRDDPVWGRTHRTASLRQAKRNANARR